MPPAKKAKGTFINPSKVTDLATWSAFYKSKYQNLRIDYPSGNPIVLNPENLAEAVKTIPLPKAYDSFRALDLFRSTDKEKFTTTLQQYNKQREDAQEMEQTKNEALQQLSLELAQAVAAYKQGPTMEGAKRVSQIQKKMYVKEKEAAPLRVVKPFEYPIPPAGNIASPPAVTYIKYTSLSDIREIDFTKVQDESAQPATVIELAE
jgi:hypothetical protein